MVVTRLRATADSFSVLLGTALQAAQDAKCESIEVWNVPRHLQEVAKATGGETSERTDNISAFKWYGQQSSPKVQSSDVVWALDEGYSWC
ncbi:hypothetical protein OPQ81_005148 [Rhizoctonia solani]|nr:hypothetical protein OPQ81_005148 [Rhizoctonia solani]